MNRWFSLRRVLMLAFWGSTFVASSFATVQQAGSVTGVTQQVVSNGSTQYHFHLNDGSTLFITPYAEDVIRVQWHWTNFFNKDEIAIQKPLDQWAMVFSTLRDAGDRYVVSTPSLDIEVTKGVSVQVHFRDLAGYYLLRDKVIEYDTTYEPLQDTSYDSLRWLGRFPQGFKMKNTKEAPPTEAYFGLGEYAATLNRRGQTIQNWNSDAFGWDEGQSPLYKSFPFYYGVQPASLEHPAFAYGVFFNNASRTVFRMADQDKSVHSFEAGDAPLDYFFFGGGLEHSMAGVLEQYTVLTGLPPLPAKWTLGYHMSKWSYSDAEVREVVQRFRDNQIPIDGIFLDLDYFDQDFDNHYSNDLHQLTFNTQFPDPAGLMDYCDARNVEVVAMIEPWLVPDDPKFPFANTNGFFVKDNAGNTQITYVWFGPGAWMDFTHGATRTWWTDLVSAFLATNRIDGIWNDLNETADDGQLRLNALYELDGQFGNSNTNTARWHQNVKNTHCIYETKTSYDALLDAYPDSRPFVLSRGGYPGIQRYAMAWSGDNIANYDHLRHNIHAGVSVMISGLAHYGHDIGGFATSTTPELLARWHEWGIFNPYCRNHYGKYDTAKEPYLYDDPYKQAIIDSIRLRYQLLPYLYALAYQTSLNGTPLNTPTAFHYMNDENTYFYNDNDFMTGPQLLVAPVVEQGASTREVYLPKGTRWFNWYDDTVYAGGTWVTVPAPLGAPPLFVPSGAILPVAPVTEHVNEAIDQLTWHIWTESMAPASSFEFYEDDGYSRAYLTNMFALTTVTHQDLHTNITVTFSSPLGDYTPAPRTRIVHLHHVNPGSNTVATLNGINLTDYSSNPTAYENASQGWIYDPSTDAIELKFPRSNVTQRVQLATPNRQTITPNGPFSTSYSELSVVGTFNSWDITASNMTLVADYTWESELEIYGDNSPRLKFVANQDWLSNWGANNQSDFSVDLFEQGLFGTASQDILFSHGLHGRYRFTLNEQTGHYMIQQIPFLDADQDGMADAWETLVGLDSNDSTDAYANPDADGFNNLDEFNRQSDPFSPDAFSSSYSQVNVTGTFNGWDINNNNMTLVGDGIWQADLSLTSPGNERFKFTANNDWAFNWGEVFQTDRTLNFTGIAESGNEDIYIYDALSGNYRFTFNEVTQHYSVTASSQSDVDADGIPDDWETMNQLSPFNQTDAALDPDEDGLSNLEEYQFGGDPFLADSDNDGIHDCDEAIAGTDLMDANSQFVLHIEQDNATGEISLNWAGFEQRYYDILMAEKLSPTSGWMPVPGYQHIPYDQPSMEHVMMPGNVTNQTLFFKIRVHHSP